MTERDILLFTQSLVRYVPTTLYPLDIFCYDGNNNWKRPKLTTNNTTTQNIITIFFFQIELNRGEIQSRRTSRTLPGMGE